MENIRNILDITCNIGVLIMFGYFFYAIYIMHKQDKETGWLDEFKKPSSK